MSTASPKSTASVLSVELAGETGRADQQRAAQLDDAEPSPRSSSRRSTVSSTVRVPSAAVCCSNSMSPVSDDAGEGEGDVGPGELAGTGRPAGSARGRRCPARRRRSSPSPRASHVTGSSATPEATTRSVSASPSRSPAASGGDGAGGDLGGGVEAAPRRCRRGSRATSTPVPSVRTRSTRAVAVDVDERDRGRARRTRRVALGRSRRSPSPRCTSSPVADADEQVELAVAVDVAEGDDRVGVA